MSFLDSQVSRYPPVRIPVIIYSDLQDGEPTAPTLQPRLAIPTARINIRELEPRAVLQEPSCKPEFPYRSQNWAHPAVHRDLKGPKGAIRMVQFGILEGFWILKQPGRI